MSGADPFFRLPTELCCAILRDWLLIRGGVRLDSAACDAEKRSLLWNTIFSSNQCVLSQRSSSVVHVRVTFDWLKLRKLRVSDLICCWDVDDSVREYLQSFGGRISQLEIVSSGVESYLPLLSAYCREVIRLSFAETKYQFTNGDVEHFSCNLKALDLTNTQITDDVLEQIVKRCSRITRICIDDCTKLSDNCGNIIGGNLKRLQHLDIAYTNLSDNALIAIAEHSHTTLEVLHAEFCFELLWDGLEYVLQKCTKLWSLHIAHYTEWFEDFDFSSLRNLTELSISKTDDGTEMYLYDLLPHCKKVERLMLCLGCNKSRPPISEQFSFTESIMQSLPNLKLLGAIEVSIDPSIILERKLEIVHSFDEFDPPLFRVNFFTKHSL